MNVDSIIQTRIERFRADLPIMEPSDIIRKHIALGDCFALDQAAHYRLISELAQHFNVHTSNVVIVGSGKLGFSIAPRKRYRPFRDQSDIDVAIVSSDLFDRFWQEVFEHRQSVGPLEPWSNKGNFLEYLFSGWIRPDKLPPEKTCELSRSWRKYFRHLTSGDKCGPYPIKAGIYKSWFYFETYQSIAVRACQQDLGES